MKPSSRHSGAARISVLAFARFSSSFWRSQNLRILFVAPLHLQEIGFSSNYFFPFFPAKTHVKP
jgi:hypothetical protein